MSRLIAALLMVFAVAVPAGTAQQEELCMPGAPLVSLAGTPEASGVTLSRRTTGILWTHEDSGQPPEIVAIDDAGSVKGRVRVTGARVDDWEAIASGPCEGGTCLFIGDIGDNARVRRRITIYRVPEPLPGDRVTRPSTAFSATYPDGARDAEALLVTPTGDLFIVSKADERTTALYKLSAPRVGVEARLELIVHLPLERVTDGTLSADGMWVALRTNDALFFYRAAELLAGRPGTPRQVNVKPVGESQGEGVALAANGSVYLVGEGGTRNGTLARLRCVLQ